MRRLLIAAVLVMCASNAHAKCYPDATGGGATCEQIPSQSIGMDGSANALSIPGSYNLLGTLAAPNGNTPRRGYYVQTQDTQADCGGTGGNAGGLLVVFDDGAGGNLSIAVLAYAGVKYGQGAMADMNGMPHNGRIQYYGTAGCVVGAHQW